MTIREMQPGDAPHVARMLHDLWLHEGEPPGIPTATIAGAFQYLTTLSAIFVAAHNEEAFGVISVTINDGWAGVGDLYVTPGSPGRAGERLIHAAAKYLASIGVDDVRVAVRPALGRECPHEQFYRRIGFLPEVTVLRGSATAALAAMRK